MNFLDLLRAGHTDYVVNDAALSPMRGRSLAGPVISQLAAQLRSYFANQLAWQAHLDRLGIGALHVTPDPICRSRPRAHYGAAVFMPTASCATPSSSAMMPVNLTLADMRCVGSTQSDWCISSTPSPSCTRNAQQRVRGLIWWFYADLKTYCAAPTIRRRAEMRARFDRIFCRRTGFATLDRLLLRLHANKAELLAVLGRPEIPLHTSNGSEQDIRCHVIKRKIGSVPHSACRARLCGDAFLGLMHTATKLGIAFWDYLGARLRTSHSPVEPYLPDLIRCRGQSV